MAYRVQIWRGLFRPQISRYQLKESEEITGFWWRLLLIYLAGILVFAAGGYFGIGSESISKEAVVLKPEQFAAARLLVFLGKAAAGALTATLYLFLPALIFWIMTDIPYIKLVIVQMVVFTLQLIEKTILIPIFVMLDLNHDGNPFALGIISQYLNMNEYFIHFFSEVSLFQIAVIVLQYFYIKSMSESSSKVLLAVICLTAAASWFLAAFCSYIQIDVLL